MELIKACFDVWMVSSACIAIAWFIVFVKLQGMRHEQELPGVEPGSEVFVSVV